MLRYLLGSLILVSLTACGKKSDDDKSSPGLSLDQQSLVQSLPGNYQQVPPGIARLQINTQNVITASTIEIPSPANDGTRVTPQFPQALVFNAAENTFTTIGTFNDGTSVFKNIEMRLRLSEDNQFLDVTLITPPDEALSLTTGTPKDPNTQPSQNHNQSHDPSQHDPSQHKPDDCKCPKPDLQLIYVYRFARVSI